jgi:hypothetical protein
MRAMRLAFPLLLVPVLACAQAAPTPATPVVVPAVAAPIADEDRDVNPMPEWIVADWTKLDRATRARLLGEARRANAWATTCRARHERIARAAQARRAMLDESAFRAAALTNPYEAFVLFRRAVDDVGWAKELDLDPWERGRFGDPLDALGALHLVTWERDRSPPMVDGAGTEPLARTTFAWGSGIPSEGTHCGHARDVGVPGILPFVFAPELRRMLRPPFDGTPVDEPLTPASPFVAGPSTFTVEGVVQSIGANGGVVVVHVVNRHQVVEQRPPCHIGSCDGIDCGKSTRPQICTEVTVWKQDVFDVAFTELPPGLVPQKGDALAVRTVENPAAVRGTLHAVILRWLDRGPESAPKRMWDLGRPSGP